ncbi:MAG TPA: NUDIX hydrolase [Candidatus Paceibacterota bacterium]|nr:NUDIX hydrolase [Verrucomicrobiota bacterium]HRY51159.1 NUDIX hydrolase [Candidatus Paceibacterota bacterium]HSA01591.1 NUDIX hydrolase [Candidatus Paceibacterota bacterium]
MSSLSENAAKWLQWAREIQALSQTGLHYAKDPYDRERYARFREIAAEILARHSSLSFDQVVQFNAAEFGHATPKVDVRGVAMREGQMLLVRELSDGGRWTLPGGWADVNETPSEAVAREVREESGYGVVPCRLLAVYDREKQGHQPPFPFHVYKLFFLCEIMAEGKSRPGETGEARFFAEEELPELSLSRVTPQQLQRFFVQARNPNLPEDFD